MGLTFTCTYHLEPAVLFHSDFVSAAKDVFGLRLDDHTRTLNASTLQFAVRDIEDMSPADVEKVGCLALFVLVFP